MTKSYRPIIVTGTGTDIGKTYVAALLCHAAKLYITSQDSCSDGQIAGSSGDDGGSACSSDKAYPVFYYKAAISGASSPDKSDASYVSEIAGLGIRAESMCPYYYKEAVSPHLAQKHEGSEPISYMKILHEFKKHSSEAQLMVVEGSGGIYCPLRWDDELDTNGSILCKEYQAEELKQLMHDTGLNFQRFTTLDVFKHLEKSFNALFVVVADACLGAINNVMTTVTSLRHEGISPDSILIILNNFHAADPMHEDNKRMIEEMTGLPVIATVAHGDTQLNLSPKSKEQLFDLTTLD